MTVNGIHRRRGRVLRVRPGHLANFSGASGYMPFIVLFSVPASFVAFLISSIVASLQVRALARGQEEDLTAYMRLARTHLLWCVGLAALMGVVFAVWAIDLIYRPSPGLVAAGIILAVGPLASWVLSTRFLFRRMSTRGPRVSLVVLALGIYVLGIAVCLVLSALFGVAIWGW